LLVAQDILTVRKGRWKTAAVKEAYIRGQPRDNSLVALISAPPRMTCLDQIFFELNRVVRKRRSIVIVPVEIKEIQDRRQIFVPTGAR
jgi:hypothetical protein